MPPEASLGAVRLKKVNTYLSLAVMRMDYHVRELVSFLSVRAVGVAYDKASTDFVGLWAPRLTE